MKQYYRVSLMLDTEDETQQDIIKVLKISGRKKSRILSLMCSYFLDSFGLDTEKLSIKDLEEIACVYPVLKRMNKAIETGQALPKVAFSRALAEEKGRKEEKPKKTAVMAINTERVQTESAVKTTKKTNSEDYVSETQKAMQRGMEALTAFGL